MNPLSTVFQQGIEALFQVTGDYGLAIIAITIVIKCCMLPLNYKQRKSMKKQQEVSQKMEEIKKKYKNQSKKADQEIQNLVAKEGTGALGCLLVFLQLPIMFSLYQVVRGGMKEGASTVVLPWISSLLSSDPYYIVPTLAVIVQILPQFFPYIKFFKNLNLPKQNMKMTVIMSIVSGWIFFFLPSGIGLYYLVSGLFTLAEQTVFNVIEVHKARKLALQ